tara:strand:+ start:2072 stop:3823 length:1752 start_codon:yes stop_codon:yes gene_type:complete
LAKNYDDIKVGDGLTSYGDYTPTKEEMKSLKSMEQMFESAKKSKEHKIGRWRRNEELYRGDFFKPFNLPKYKSRIVVNTVHSTVETIYSILTDRKPKTDIMPKREDQVDQARIAQEAVESEMDKNKFTRAVSAMKKDGLIYGNGFLKIYYDVEAGSIRYSTPDPYTVFIDPLATNLSDASCVIFATPRYVDDIKNEFPNGKYVKSEGTLNEYKSFVKHSDKYAETKDYKTDLREESPSYREDSTTDHSYKGGQVLLKEAWYWKGSKLMLCTWAGKILLQQIEAPYDFIPLVSFKNYMDAHSVWGKGEPEIIETLSVGTSILLSQGLDNIIYQGNPAIVMSKAMAKHPGNRPTDKPGQIFYTAGPHEQINRLPAGNISASTLPMAQNLIQMSDTVSGVHDITQGRNPSGVTAGRAIAQLQEASQQIIRTKEREVGQDAIIDCYRMTLSILKNNYEKQIAVRNFTEGTGLEFRLINPFDLDDDMDYKYIPGSSMPESRASRFDQGLDLIQAGLLDQEKFWRWTQKDISKEILEEILEIKKQQMQQEQADIEAIAGSTDEDEIMEAKLRLMHKMGYVNPEEPQVEQ